MRKVDRAAIFKITDELLTQYKESTQYIYKHLIFGLYTRRLK